MGRKSDQLYLSSMDIEMKWFSIFFFLHFEKDEIHLNVFKIVFLLILNGYPESFFFLILLFIGG